uniref:Protein kinase domain-containing protein n=1 Tax=Cucumis melo TaxID=3656 RepID=A0A9I9EG65_CUCME
MAGSCQLNYEIVPIYAAILPPPIAPLPPPDVPFSSMPPTQTPGVVIGDNNNNNNNTERIVKIVVSSTVSVFIVIFLILILFLRKRKRKQQLKRTFQTSHQSTNEMISIEMLQYDFETIKLGTNGFSSENKIGQGGFGAVYKGKLPSGQEIAVKRLAKDSQQGDVEFRNEVLLVAKLHHRNLVRLLGFCMQNYERLPHL